MFLNDKILNLRGDIDIVTLGGAVKQSLGGNWWVLLTLSKGLEDVKAVGMNRRYAFTLQDRCALPVLLQAQRMQVFFTLI